MNYLNWGTVQQETTFFRGCKIVDCSGHGGIILSPKILTTHAYFSKIKDYDFSGFRLSSGSYAFEEDMEANIILACLPQSLLSKHYSSCLTMQGYQHFIEERLSALKSNYPEIFTLLTGITLSIFDSQQLFQDYLNSQTGLLYRDGSFSGYNVPDGFVAISVKTSEKKCQGQYLVPRQLHDKIKMPIGRLGYAPIDPNLLDTPFQIDFWTPGSKCKAPQPDRFYISHTRKVKESPNKLLLLAYNYQTKSKMCFEMTEEYYFANKVGDNGIQVDENLDLVNAPFVNKSSITAEQFMNA